ncbi:MAG: hypothetical protein IJ521_09445 [Schwartzia sp.]|nr:hypothetical protein [Schwartzia sp. (in: firmicutes)]
MKKMKRVHFWLPRKAQNEGVRIIAEAKIVSGNTGDINDILLRMMYRMHEQGEGGEPYGATGKVA